MFKHLFRFWGGRKQKGGYPLRNGQPQGEAPRRYNRSAKGGRNRSLVPVRDRHPQSRQQTYGAMHLYHGSVSHWNWDVNTLQVKTRGKAKANRPFAFKPGDFTPIAEGSTLAVKCIFHRPIGL